ncbi:hypothetical protein EIP91_008223 [Steccherinum ochraceum]|uniref:Uncharacterized protein n=1 Tax=Steccherinum ochraceum TaxID=92696 RepID=A0A4R0RYF5_9APHY|nr:hypothetical protein EIP91_008223 [Steccherinum ochraceum]
MSAPSLAHSSSITPSRRTSITTPSPPFTMISCSATTPNLSRSSTCTQTSLSSSYSSSLITPASALGPSFVRIQDDFESTTGKSRRYGLDLGTRMDLEAMEEEGEAGKGSPRVMMSTSLASAVRKAKTFAKRTVNANVRRVISKTKPRSSTIAADTSEADLAQVQHILEDPHSVITEEQRTPAVAPSNSFPSLSSLREVTHSTIGFVPISLQNKASISSLSLVAVHGSPNPYGYDSEEEQQPPLSAADPTPISTYGARVALFVPWCILVGGLILFHPAALPRLVASPGTSTRRPSHALTPVLPAPGPRRFAYWAECAFHHVAIFLGCVISALWVTSGIRPTTSTCIFGALLARWMFVWKSGFGLKDVVGGKRRLFLGENDAESVWLVFTEEHLSGGNGVEIYVGDACMPKEHLAPLSQVELKEVEDETGDDE